MKIVFVIRSIANKGGVERTLTDKANALSDMGHQVTIVTYEQGNHPFAFELDSNILHKDLDCRKFTLYRYPLFLRLFKMWIMNKRMKSRWNAFVDELRPDVVVTTTYSGDFMSELMSVHKKIPVVVESHTAFTHDMQPHEFLKKIRQKLLLRVLKRCSLLIALTEGDKQCWGKHIKNVRKVSNPVSFYIESIENVKREKGRILCVGRLHEQKRYDRLISAFARVADNYPDWSVDIFGKGDLRQDLERQIVSMGLEGRVVIHDPSNAIAEEYLKSELFVLSSDYEGLPLVLLEAMACGVPSVATRCPFGPDEVIENGVTGLLADLNVEDLSEKMEWMMTHEIERTEMGRRAHIAAASYRKDVVIKQWEQAYLSVLG